MNFLEALIALQLTVRTQWFVFKKYLMKKLLTSKRWRIIYFVWLKVIKMNFVSDKYYGKLPSIKPVYDHEEVTCTIDDKQAKILLKYKDGQYYFLMELSYEVMSKIDNVLELFYDAVRKDKAGYVKTNPVNWMPSAVTSPMIDDTEVLTIIRAMFPNIPWDKEVVHCPEPECVANKRDEPDLFRPSNIIMHINDRHHWTRERIADWLEEQPWDIYSTIEKEEVHVDP